MEIFSKMATSQLPISIFTKLITYAHTERSGMCHVSYTFLLHIICKKGRRGSRPHAVNLTSVHKITHVIKNS